MRSRAEAQKAGWEKWVAETTMEAVNTAVLDREEAKAVDASINRINDVIFKDLKLTPDDFMEINLSATNFVRSKIGLASLSSGEYSFMYMSGIGGLPVRFFTA